MALPYRAGGLVCGDSAVQFAAVCATTGTDKNASTAPPAHFGIFKGLSPSISVTLSEMFAGYKLRRPNRSRILYCCGKRSAALLLPCVALCGDAALGCVRYAWREHSCLPRSHSCERDSCAYASSWSKWAKSPGFMCSSIALDSAVDSLASILSHSRSRCRRDTNIRAGTGRFPRT